MLNLNWQDHITYFWSAISTALLTQAIFSLWKLNEIKGLKSAAITALGICLLLRTNSELVMAFAAFIGIAAKFMLRINNKHLFNPSNIGIIILLIITDSAWISPGQWGNDVVLLFMVIATGSIVLLKVGRLDVTYIFLGSLFVMEYVRTVLFLGWGMDVLLHKFTSGSLLLFAFFMITDPKTTPDNKSYRYFWTLLLAMLTFALSQWFYLYTSSIWALFLITPFTVLIDKFFPAKRFVWYKSQDKINPLLGLTNKSTI